MIINDKELKKELDKIPDVDERGDPIYKIDTAEASDEITDETPATPLFLVNNSDAPKGNAQDVKDAAEE